MSEQNKQVVLKFIEAMGTSDAAAAGAQPASQDDWVHHIRETAVDVSRVQRDCPPSYLNNEGSDKFRYYLGEFYGPGFAAFEKLLHDWRDEGNLQGLVVSP